MRRALGMILLQALVLSLVGCSEVPLQKERDLDGASEETTVCMADERFSEIVSGTNALAPGAKLEDALTQFGQLSESLRVTTLAGKKRPIVHVVTSVTFSRCSRYRHGSWLSDIESVTLFFDKDSVLYGVLSRSKLVPSWGELVELTLADEEKRERLH